MHRLIFLALSNAVTGREAEYQDWYVNRHLDDVLDVPGFATGQFFRILAPEGAPRPRWGYAGLYELDGPDAATVLGALAARSGTDRMQVSTAIDRDGIVMSPWIANGDWIDAAGAAGEEAKRYRDVATHRYFALSDPVEGSEAPYNAWYDRQHLPDVLRVPGFVGAQRFEAVPWGSKPAPTRHLTLYALNAPETALPQMRSRAGTPEMPISPDLDRERVTMLLAEPLVPLRASPHTRSRAGTTA